MFILVIDDDIDVRKMICKILSKAHYDVLEAANGYEATDLLKNNSRISLVITDMIMPEKEGVETIIELKQDYPHIKILAISGGGKGYAQDYLEIAKGIGADLALKKPFMTNELIDAVTKLMIAE